MIALIQRVSSARVDVDGTTVGAIGPGLLALIGVRPDDDAARGARLLERLLTYRVFPDEADRMNRSLVDTGGGLLLVPQFTLAADTRRGTRPGFSTAAPPAQAEALFGRLVAEARARHPDVASGHFGADMRVSLVNEGPVTFWLES
ncbi:MAG: D-aminoacyl-tRNA deacylase [Steroidobacteraceae bacterium]|jgi:D-tyrosyl-tRNA(Tyr) deacylase|nr:D-aminoacyl-tRNA deacylase [Steroidobacteraceae bacterium]